MCIVLSKQAMKVMLASGDVSKNNWNHTDLKLPSMIWKQIIRRYDKMFEFSHFKYALIRNIGLDDFSCWDVLRRHQQKEVATSNINLVDPPQMLPQKVCTERCQWQRRTCWSLQLLCHPYQLRFGGAPAAACIFDGLKSYKKRYEMMIPIGSMYVIFTSIWLIFMVNVGKYTVHGSYGI